MSKLGKILTIITITLLAILPVTAVPNPGHRANNISGGTFSDEDGDFIFPTGVDVGISGVTPVTDLDVGGTIRTGEQVSISAAPVSPTYYIHVGADSTTEPVALALSQMDGVQNSRAWLMLNAESNELNLSHAWSAGGDLSYKFGRGRMMIESGTGHVAIANEDPDSELHVTGGACIDDDGVCTDPGAGSLNVENNVGIGTDTVPHGGIGYARLALDGPSSNANGPHIQYTTTASDYPVRQDMHWTNDNAAINFDSYYDGSWRSSDAGSNFQIRKNGDVIGLNYDNGVAQGGAVGWNVGWNLDTSGHLGVRTNGQDTELHVLGGVCIDSDAACNDPGAGAVYVAVNAGVGADPVANVGVYSTAANTGVRGEGGATGLYGSGTSQGVYGIATGAADEGVMGIGATGTYGSGTDQGVYGIATGANDEGVMGLGDTGVYGSGTSQGVYGLATGASDEGVMGVGDTGVYGDGVDYSLYGAVATTSVYGTGSTYGVYGTSAATGVYGDGATGVYADGVAYSVYAAAANTGVFGTGSAYAAYFDGSGTGVYGDGATGVYGSGTGQGVYGIATAANAEGVYGTGATGVYGDGTDYSVYGDAATTSVYGTGSTYAVYGAGGSTGVYGSGTVRGVSAFGGLTGIYSDGTAYSVYATSAATSIFGSGTSFGAYIIGDDGAGGATGIYGLGDNIGIYGVASDGAGSGFGVFGSGVVRGVTGLGDNGGAVGTGVYGSGVEYSVYALGEATSVYGDGVDYSFYGALAVTGVFGSGSSYGVAGQDVGGLQGYLADSANSAGVSGVGGSYGGRFTGTTGVYGSGTNQGVYGIATGASDEGVMGVGDTGVYGDGVDYSVYATSAATSIFGSGTSFGAYIVGDNGAGGATGIYGVGDNIGIYGVASDATGSGFGVFGSGVARGVTGLGDDGASTGTGVYGSGVEYSVYALGEATSIYGNGISYSIYGDVATTSVYGTGSTFGVYGVGALTGVYGEGSTGVYATATSTGIRGAGVNTGVYGISTGATGIYGSGLAQGVYAQSAGTALNGRGGDTGVYASGGVYGGSFYSSGASTVVYVNGAAADYGIYVNGDTGEPDTGVYVEAVSAAGYSFYGDDGTFHNDGGAFVGGNSQVNGYMSIGAGPTIWGGTPALMISDGGGTDTSGGTENSGILHVGLKTGAHMNLDENEIQAKASGTTEATLHFNWDGGDVTIGQTALVYDESQTEIEIEGVGVCISNGVCPGSETTGNLRLDDGSLCVDNDDAAPTCPAAYDTSDGRIYYDTSNTAFDLAEFYYTRGDVSQGYIVRASEDFHLVKSSRKYDNGVVGVVSTTPNIVFGMNDDLSFTGLGGTDETVKPGRAAIALSGRIPVAVCLENGVIEPGDSIASSSTSGYGMKWTLMDTADAKDFDELKKIIAENELRRGSIVGKALEGFDGTGPTNVQKMYPEFDFEPHTNDRGEKCGFVTALLSLQ